MIEGGSIVKMHYTLKVDGAVVDSSAGGEPLEFIQGEGQIIPGLERELASANPGDKKIVTVGPEQGYGEARAELVQKVPREAFSQLKDLTVGSVVRGEGPGGVFQASVTELTEAEVTLDLNHPLAGKTLVFDVEVVGVAAAPSKLILPP
ncbi:MAG: peptidylprolyl isomerase [Elusimicrobiota bacterium]